MIILKFLERHDSLMKYSIILEPQEEGGFTACCLELPGAISQGETKKRHWKISKMPSV